MSHASGKVKFISDGTEFWFEYDGTADIAMPKLFVDNETLCDNWRTDEWPKCTCGNDEEVEITSHYGNGRTWDGKACRRCMCITEGFDPYKEPDDYLVGFYR